MKLGRQFLLLVTGVFVLALLIMWLVFQSMVSEINRDWSNTFVERQVLFDKFRTFSPLIREVNLARRMVADPALSRMARDEQDPAARAGGLALLDRYRLQFGDHSVFAAFSKTGHYYYEDGTGTDRNPVPRYTLSRDNPDDAWFFATLAAGKPYQINIARDVHLNVTKVWINILIQDGTEVVGVAGTGMNLTEFLAQTVNLTQPGIHNVFIDDTLAIRLSSDPGLIDYATIGRPQGPHVTVENLFDHGDVERLRTTLREVREHPTATSNLWVEFQGSRYLLGVAWLPDIGWYDLTLVNQKNLALLRGLSFMPYALGALLLVVLAVLGFALQQWVLQPLMALKKATDALQRGDFDVLPPLVGSGEVGDLSRSFRHMVTFVRTSHRELEARVRERTEALQRLSEIDGLTALLNRRGIMERFDQELSRLERTGGTLGLLLLDLDHFKDVNDAYGHAAGDLALVRTAQVIRALNRPYDYAGRYGGEEFLVILPECSPEDLESIGERLRQAIAALDLVFEDRHFTLTASIGLHHVQGVPENRDLLLHKTDKALYAAKQGGRNQVRLYAGPCP